LARFAAMTLELLVLKLGSTSIPRSQVIWPYLTHISSQARQAARPRWRGRAPACSQPTFRLGSADTHDGGTAALVPPYAMSHDSL
ncbi:MAG: hypothetical protein LJE91_05965, partial [Gammaproteobacteria bacterium]|nr:hypothetical protein [Gammaproteobacteria bacterium]